MALEVIGAGLGRTGTLSLKRALEQLGYVPCYHMVDVAEVGTRAEDWLQASKSTAPDWDHIFRGFRATVDWPAATYWRELSEAYPKAKVILSVRDPEAWFESTQKTIFQRARIKPLSDAFREMVERVVFGMFDGQIKDRGHCIEVFERHNRTVMDTIPADRLLVFEAHHGWEPLCSFLGLPIPDSPYPHVNKATDFEVVSD